MKSSYPKPPEEITFTTSKSSIETFCFLVDAAGELESIEDELVDKEDDC
jgi:hypothetical protein